MCKNIQNIDVTKKVLVSIILYGLSVNSKGISRRLNKFQRMYELRYIFHKLILDFLKNPCNNHLGITNKQLSQILNILTKEQLLKIGYGLDKNRLNRAQMRLDQ